MEAGQHFFVLENWFIVRQTSLGFIWVLPSITSRILRELGVQLGGGTYLSWVAIITFVQCVYLVLVMRIRCHPK